MDELGRGGRSVTYRVRLRSSVYAMKILQRRSGEELPERAFRREAALLASVNDPGIVRVHEVGVAQGLPYLVMDYVDGRSLSGLLVDGPLPVERVVAIGVDVADALGAAHRARLVHRDIKPDNILVSATGRARLIDFGLAVRQGEFHPSSMAGTLLYCAPEQAGTLRRPVDGRADLYALGAVLFECATGRPPFVSRDVGELLRMHATAAVADPRVQRPELPVALAGVIGKLMAKDPDDRYQTAAGVGSDLRRLANGETDFALGTADLVGARPDRPLIGREPELAALLDRWERAQDGAGGGVALVEGAPGTGKSRLAREVAAAARRSGGLVLIGESEPEEGVPLAPLRRAVEDYLAGVALLRPADRDAALDRVRAAAGTTASLLRGLSPALDAVLAAPGLGDDDRHQQFSLAVAAFFASLTAGAGGALLVLDDVQWLSGPSRRVVSHLTERLDEVPLFILATGRNDSDSALALSQFRAAVDDSLDLTVRLQPLPAEVVGNLVSSATGGLAVDTSTAARLAARSDGNPFTLLQYVDAVLDAGLLRPDWGKWRLDTEALPGVDLPGRGVDLILRRLSGLDRESRYVLGVGAVYGSVFGHALIADVCGLPRPRVLEIANEAAWRNVIERRDGGRFAFLHDRIREALLAEFDRDATQAVHESIADALAQAGGTDAESVYALARHCQLGDSVRDPGRLYRACYAAGRTALAEHAPAEALGHLDRAAAAAQSAGIAVDCAFLLILATAQQRSGRFGEAITTARLAHQQGSTPIERARALGLVAQALGTAWQMDEQSEVILQALGELGVAPAARRRALLVSSVWRFLLGHMRRWTRIGYGTARGAQRAAYRLEAALYAAGSSSYARQMQPIPAMIYVLREMYPVTRIGPGVDEARLRLGLALIDMSAGLRRRGRRNIARAQAIADRLGDPILGGYVAWVDALTMHNQGYDQGQRLRRVLDEQGRWLELGLQSDMIFILIWDALIRGEIREAQRLADRRETLLKHIGDSGEATARFESGTAVRGARAGLLAWQDRGDDARAAAKPGPAENAMPVWELLPVRGAAMVVAYEQHDLGDGFDRAVEEFDNLNLTMRMLVPLALGFYVVRAMGRLEQCRLATGAARAQRLAQAQRAVEQLRPAARTPLLRAHYELTRAALLQLRGEPKAALDHLTKHEETMRSVDAPVIAFEAARIRAHALRELRVVGEAERQAQTALTIAREQDWRHRARHTMAEFGLDPRPSTSVRNTATTNETISLGRVRQRLDAIEQLGLAASRVLDPARLAVIALDETIRILGAERAYLFQVERGQLLPHGGRDAAGNDIAELVGYSASTVDQVLRTGRPVVITGTEEGAAASAQSVVLHGLRSIMVAPMQLDGRLLGIVYLDSRVAKGIFNSEDVGVLIAITNHIAVALETARAAQLEVAVAAANRQRDLAETLRDAVADITGTLEPEPEAVLLRLERAVVGIVGGDRAWLVLGSPHDAKVRVYPGSALQPSTVERQSRLAELLASTSTRVGDGAAGRPELMDGDEHSWLAVPLRTRQEQLGLLLLASTRPHAYDDGRADLATALVGQAMVAYDNARLFAQIQHLATIDDLTGIANRRQFFDLGRRELARARRGEGGLTAMMIDIDNFKTINDEYGHQVGDEVIASVAGRLSALARTYDLLGRYGGEEFALLVPTGEQDPRGMAERLRTAIAENPVPTRAGALTVTVSVGAATLRPDDVDINALLGRADRRLFEAKRGGRNRIAAD